MQLFIVSESTVQIKWNILYLEDKRVVTQLSRVLRAKPWYECYVQTSIDNYTYRRHISLRVLTPTHIEADIIAEEKRPYVSKTAFFVPLPNKRDKIDLIVQKLTEVGIDQIFLRRAERSQLKSVPQQKFERRNTIILEAAEQAWRWNVPQLQYVESLKHVLTSMTCVVFDLPRNNLPPVPTTTETQKEYMCWIIWPEWGLSDADYAMFPHIDRYESLGGTVLRMETAAIIGGWQIAQLMHQPI